MTSQIAAVEADDRRDRILDGAMKVFLAYGFARTTMDDIARSADISRPTLYLSFRNKADIFRAIGTCLLRRSLKAAAAALRKEGPFEERVMRALDGAIFSLMEMIDNSPHGEELWSIENTIASDIISDWRADLTGILEEAVALEARKVNADLEAVGLSARSFAEMLLDALEGMRVRGLCGLPVKERMKGLVTITKISLTAAPPKR